MSTIANYKEGKQEDRPQAVTWWRSPIVVLPKTAPNQAFCPEVYHTLTVEETLGSLAEGSLFSERDADLGFHVTVLYPESAQLTNSFHYLLGRCMFKRLTFEICLAS